MRHLAPVIDRQIVMVPRIQVVVAPPTHTAPASSVVMRMLWARPTRAITGDPTNGLVIFMHEAPAANVLEDEEIFREATEEPGAIR